MEHSKFGAWFMLHTDTSIAEDPVTETTSGSYLSGSISLSSIVGKRMPV